MAPRTGAKHLLAPKGRVASAGYVLALAAALALAVSGCGGDSETQTASTSRPERASLGSKTSEAEPKGKAKPSAAGGSESNPPRRVPSGQAKAKQSPPIVLPKGAPDPAPTPAQRANATVADIVLSSTVLQLGPEGVAILPSTNTCDGKDTWPALRWQGVPSGTAELVLFAMNVQPVEGKLFFDWAVAGLDPALEGVESARLPPGAVSGRNGYGQTGYSICPSTGQGETYIFALYALPRRLSPRQGFDPRQLREAVLEQSGNVGLMAASYARG